MAETPATVFKALDLSEKNLKKLPKPAAEESQVCSLILDDNDLQRLEGVDAFNKLQKLSAVRNQLLRMYGVCRLHTLHTLNLAHNGILTIEGLKDLIQLKYLNLAGNSIKSIEHLQSNINLEQLDLSENAIIHITDLSYIKNLKELQLHNNRITHLRQCERFLPASLATLTLANNSITDLNEISQLVHLTNLNSVSIANNPCVIMTGQKIGFDYRPFILNWCMSVQVIDGYVVDAIENLRGEWLYSQGRGRHFRIGYHDELCQYLASVCPISGEQQLETEEDRKLRLILSKAQHHQQQLREQGSSPMPSPSARKKFNAKRLHSARLNNSKSPDKMSASCYNTTATMSSGDSGINSIMSQSLDPSILNQSGMNNEELKVNQSHNSTFNSSMSSTKENGVCLDDYEVVNSPLQALSKLVPVPETLMSPDYRPSSLSSRLSTISTIPTPTASQKPTPRFVQPVSRSPKPTRSNIAKPKASLNLESKRTNSPSPVRNRKVMPASSTPRPNNQLMCSPPLHPKPLVSVLKKTPSTEDESEVCDLKLQPIQMKAEEKRIQKDVEGSCNSSSTEEKAELAAVFIQKMWRGYYIRNRDKSVQDKYKKIQSQRADEYLKKLVTDMESTKAALESERKIQLLQMQAINALWKKVSSLQPEDIQQGTNTGSSCNNVANCKNGAEENHLESKEIVSALAVTCSSLQNQVQQLQGSMQDMVKFMSFFAQQQINKSPPHSIQENVIATQTEIVAVHTPQGEAGKMFPFQKQLRPSSLPLPVGSKTPKRDAHTSTTSANVANHTSSNAAILSCRYGLSSCSDSTTTDADVRNFAGSLVDGAIRTVSEGPEESQNATMAISDTYPITELGNL